MRKPGMIIVLLAGILFFCCGPCAFGQEEAPPTWDGELDPNELYHWEIIAMQPVFGADAVTFYLLNPDLESPIKVVAALCRDVTIELLAYSYLTEDESCVYTLDVDRNRYVGECIRRKPEEPPMIEPSLIRRSI